MDGVKGKILTAPRISQLIYKTDFPNLRDQVLSYLSNKAESLILIDNLDRGWTAAGVNESDIRIVQCLLNAGRKIEREANKYSVAISSVVFIRDDVYMWLIDQASDRGKESIVRIQWRDTELLKQIIELRLEAASYDMKIDPPLKWVDISDDKDENRIILDLLIHHCLRRPRSLLDLVELGLSNAALAGKSSISLDDAKRAVATYSTDMLRDLNYEIRDIFPDANKIIYAFARQNVRLDLKNVERIVRNLLSDKDKANHFIRLMLWFGFFGIIGPGGEENYIFDHGDDLDLLISHSSRSDNFILCIHPLFREALSVRRDLLL
jgi:hypothetical protein